MSKIVVSLADEQKKLHLVLRSRRHEFAERAGPYRYFSLRDGPIFDYGCEIVFRAGESMTLA